VASSTVEPASASASALARVFEVQRHAGARAGGRSSAASRELLLAGIFFAMLNWPPICAAASNRCTSWPRSASVVAAASPPARRRPRRALLRQRALRHQLGLVPGARVDEAAGDLQLEGVVQAGLVAGDAGVDLVGAALAAFARSRVGQQRARHGHHVGAPSARSCSATSGMLMRLLVISG
jgi:hypothetical protein